MRHPDLNFHTLYHLMFETRVEKPSQVSLACIAMEFRQKSGVCHAGTKTKKKKNSFKKECMQCRWMVPCDHGAWKYKASLLMTVLVYVYMLAGLTWKLEIMDIKEKKCKGTELFRALNKVTTKQKWGQDFWPSLSDSRLSALDTLLLSFLITPADFPNGWGSEFQPTNLAYK